MRPSLRHAVIAGVATVGLVLGVDSVTLAATGDSVILGEVNRASQTTTITRTTGGPTLTVGSANYAQAPFAVNGKRMVTNLNADRVDNLHGSQLQRRLTSGCPDGQALAGIGGTGVPQCVTVAPAEMKTFRYTSPDTQFQGTRTFAVGQLAAGHYRLGFTASAETTTGGTPSSPVSLQCTLRRGTAAVAAATAVDTGGPGEMTLSASTLVSVPAAADVSVRCVPTGTLTWRWESVPLTVYAEQVTEPTAFGS